MIHWVIAFLSLATANAAFAGLITVDFESDTAGSKGSSYTSPSSSVVTFSGTSLRVGTWAVESSGSQALVVFGEESRLDMDFSVDINSLSIDFGNDDPDFIQDRAILTVFLDAIQVGQTVLLYNKNDFMDETISVSGIGAFNRANLVYTDNLGNPFNALAEVVDNVTFYAAEPVSAPATFGLLGFALAGLGWIGRRKA